MSGVYVASSCRNEQRQQHVVRLLRSVLDVPIYDFREPEPGVSGFSWSEIDPAWQSWSAESFRDALGHHIAFDWFHRDFDAMKRSSLCVLVLPCGRSAHLEAGYFAGDDSKRLIIALDQTAATPVEPELMYKLADEITVDDYELIAAARRLVGPVAYGGGSR